MNKYENEIGFLSEIGKSLFEEGGEIGHIELFSNIIKALEKLAEYEDLEEQGRLIILPCKVGDTTYEFENNCIKIKCEHWHEGSDIFRDDACCSLDDDDERHCKDTIISPLIMASLLHIVYNLPYFGKTVFLTQEEAQIMLESEGIK